MTPHEASEASPSYPEEMIWWTSILEKLSRRESLSPADAHQAGRRIFSYLKERRPETAVILSCYLGALSVKEATVDELVGTAFAMEETKKFSFKFNIPGPVVTGGGTGGDTLKTINVTTPAAIIASSTGATVVKSAANAFSGKTGAADLAATLGINVDASPETVKNCVEKLGTTVWASAGIYPWMEPLLTIRYETYAPAIFPLMKSLRLVIATALNPFSARRQVRGTAEENTELIAQVLGRVGFERAFVPLGYGPHKGIRIDEFSNLGPTRVSELKPDGMVKTYDVHPEDFGVETADYREVEAADTHEENARRVLQVLSGKERGARRDLILVNAASLIMLADGVKSLKDGYEAARQALEEGRALSKLEQLVEASGGRPALLKKLLY